MHAKDNPSLARWRTLRNELDFSSDLAQKGWYHSFELPDGRRIDGHNSLATLKGRLAAFPIPLDLKGVRALDIGAWDGWFSFELEKRGAEVVAIDCVDQPSFRSIHKELGSRVNYRLMDVYDVSPDSVGRFDIVLFLSVLYHLEHPLLALERVCSVVTRMAAVSSFITDPPDATIEAMLEKVPQLEFYETDELGGQADNWFGPNLSCLTALCRTAGFARVEVRSLEGPSALVACYRQWEEQAGNDPAPLLHAAVNNRTGKPNFSTGAEEFVACWLRCERQLDRENVQPEVGGYGIRPIYVGSADGLEWQVNFRLPPGLAAGSHDVRIRRRGSAWSNACPIAVDLPPAASPA